MRIRFALILGVLFLAMPGCFHHWGYYPNGYYGPGPSVLPSQPWNGYSGGPVYQPGGPVYQQPGGPVLQPGVPINQPGGNYPTPIDGSTPGQSPYIPADPNSPSTYGPGSGTSAPTFDPTTPGSVPTPPDDDFGRQPGAQRPTITPTSAANSSDDLSSPFRQQDSTQLPRDFSNSQIAEAESRFETPVVQASGTASNDVRLANQQSEATPVSFKKFGTHPKFEWVQGVVEYDDISSTWVVMYNDNPRSSDPYGGELTIADDPSLSRLRSGEVYKITGTLDSSEQDSRGKPVYRMTKAELRRPLGQ